ncbi:hypothetical protein PHLCEN_2v13307 [Hermanssonia centrifuga]|uniref:Polysaccharide lyase 14 domain-containing protein n=1 Tax=Hermanssonia centrifuga TaxID=98765 RepID=A0A2R6NEV4_9APHY|nr:hypothetical protein PHLCEN_2v13307 [Hermanssonia centrifuga]
MSSVATNLFPVPPTRIVSGFTTCSLVDVPHVAKVALSDSALGIHKVSSQTSHNIVTPPCPEPVSREAHPRAWEAFFPEGSINPGNKQTAPGGFGFYMQGPGPFHKKLTQETPDEVVMSYEVMFEEGWEWRKGGKLPGIYGGVGESAYGCTGGRQTDRCKCFNLRLMWRENGTGELYAYLPQDAANTAAMLAIPPRSIQHPDYGFSVGRGAWKFVTGKWTAVAERVKMNTVGKANGEIEVFIDGRSVIKAIGLVLRDQEAPSSCVRGMHFQTFFGGHSEDWASPKDQKAWFTNVSGAILRPSAQPRDEL